MCTIPRHEESYIIRSPGHECILLLENERVNEDAKTTKPKQAIIKYQKISV